MSETKETNGIGGLIKLAAIVGALSGIAGSVGTFAVNNWRLDDLELRVTANATRIESNAAAINQVLRAIEADLAVTKNDVAWIRQQLSGGARR